MDGYAVGISRVSRKRGAVSARRGFPSPIMFFFFPFSYHI